MSALSPAHTRDPMEPAPALPPARPGPSRLMLFLWIAAILIASFAFQWPTDQVADWQHYALYDPGTILKGDLLLARGYIPTVDFGYTHGLISLLLGHLAFGLFGRTPWTFLGCTLLLEIGMAYALARIAFATGLARRPAGLIFLLLGLPLAIMPAYLTLTHPLEAMLILFGLANHAEGKKRQALALMTACLFVKPSMAYVYGFLLLVLIAWESRAKFRRLVGDLLPAAATLLILMGVLTYRFGVLPVIKTLLPLTGGKTYATTHFGFFSDSGRAFWMPANAWDYVRGPNSIFLIAAAITTFGAAAAAFKLLKRNVPDSDRPCWEMLMTIGFLHTAFLLGFYGWTGSWSYYSYLPVLGAAMTVMLLARDTSKTWLYGALSVLMVMAHTRWVAISLHGWSFKTPHVETIAGDGQGLWRYDYQRNGWDYQMNDWRAVVKLVGDANTLVMTNGFLFNLPPTIQMPDAWFPEPGIPTASEIERVRKQAQWANYVVLCNEYGDNSNKEHPDLQLWSFPEFAPERAQFEQVLKNGMFTVMKRKE